MKFKLWFKASAFLVLVPSLLFGIAVNDAVVATANLNVRGSASTSGTLLYTVPTGTQGVISGGPATGSGYTWWYIVWATHPGQPGWSIQDYLSVQPAGTSAFSDNYGYGWHLRPWSNTSVNMQPYTVRSGSSALGVAVSAAYGRLYIETTAGFHTGIPSSIQTLRLSLLNQNTGGQQLYVGLYDTAGNVIHYLPAWNYVYGGTLNQGTWYDLVIPLSDLWAVNRSIGGIVVEQGTTGNFYADEVYLSTASGSTYWTPPASTITAVGAGCYPTTLQVGQTATCAATVIGTGNYSSAVTWSATAGSITSSGTYTAPSTVPNPSTVAVIATSVQDPSKSGTQPIAITAPTVSQASDAVYTDSMGTGWRVASRTNVFTDLTSDTIYTGDYGMETNIATTPWGRTQFLMQSNYKFNTSSYNYLSFAVNIGRPEGEILYVGLFNSSGNVIQYVTLSTYTANQTLPGYQWQLVHIPLTALGIVSATDVYGVEIQSATAATFYVDEIRFKGDCN